MRARMHMLTFQVQLLQEPGFEMQLLMQEFEVTRRRHAHGDGQACILDSAACSALAPMSAKPFQSSPSPNTDTPISSEL